MKDGPFGWLRRIATRLSRKGRNAMNVPHSGRVVVVDDMLTEAAPLLAVLSKHGVPAFYFTGTDQDQLPSKPLAGTRVVFLDIDLGFGGDDKSKISTVMAVLGRLIGPSNGPYLVLAWTKHPEDVEALQLALDKFRPAPVKLLDMEKTAYLTTRVSEDAGAPLYDFVPDALAKIENKLRAETEELGAAQVYFTWEDIAHAAAGGVTADLHSLAPAGPDWNRNASGILVRLAKATAGEQLPMNDPAAVTQNALRTLNSVYVDALESRIASDNRLKAVRGLDMTVPALSHEAVGRLNTRLILAEVVDTDPIQPGDLFRLQGNDFGIVLNDHIDAQRVRKFSAQPALDKVQFVVAEVSPPCDYAQAKWVRHRFLPGFLCPCAEGGHSIVDNTDRHYRWKSGVIEVDGMAAQLVFDLRNMTSRELRDIPWQRFLRVRRTPLADILARLASHVGRPGVISLDG